MKINFSPTAGKWCKSYFHHLAWHKMINCLSGPFEQQRCFSIISRRPSLSKNWREKCCILLQDKSPKVSSGLTRLPRFPLDLPLMHMCLFAVRAYSVPTSSLLPGPDCCLSAQWRLSRSGSASQWRCGGLGTLTGPLDTCLKARNTKDRVHIRAPTLLFIYTEGFGCT